MKKIVLLVFISISFLFAAEGFVTYKVGDKEYKGYYSTPSKDAPLVYIVHDWDGLTDYEIKRTKMLYDLGYASFAVDLYGKGVRPTALEDKKRLTSELYQNREKMRTLLDAGLEVAKSQGANISNAVGIGYCFGGSAILEMARSGADLKSFISFHGGLATPKGEDYSKTKGKIIVFHGGADKVVPINDFSNLSTQLENEKIDYEMIIYSGAPHAFSVIGSKKYHKKADEESWVRFTEVLDNTLK